MTTTFSIIVPCYNLEAWIRTCLDSVRAQSFADWECIVVDDESRDGSPAILDAYAARDSRIREIHQKNAGEGGARNAGLAVAKGEWVFFLDGDDVMAPGALETLSEVIRNHPRENLIRFEFAPFDDGEALPRQDETLPLQTRVVDISRQIAVEDYFVYVWQFAFRRSLIEGMAFAHHRRGADRTFIVPILCSRTNSFVAVSATCYLYRKRAGSATNRHASVQAMKDELSHRLDVIETIDRCEKRVSYCRSEWLERYCLYDYLYVVRSKVATGESRRKTSVYSASERRELIAWFYHELPRICCAKGYSPMGKVHAQLYRVLRGSLGRCIVSRIIPGLLFRAMKRLSRLSAFKR